MRGFGFFTGSEDLPYNAVPVADVVVGYFNYRRTEVKAELEPNYRKKEIRESRKIFPECHKNNLHTLVLHHDRSSNSASAVILAMCSNLATSARAGLKW